LGRLPLFRRSRKRRQQWWPDTNKCDHYKAWNSIEEFFKAIAFDASRI
jgi:hypothetical protein